MKHWIKKHLKWIIIAFILAFTIGIEAYKGEGKLPWAILFAGVVVVFLSNASFLLIGPFISSRMKGY